MTHMKTVRSNWRMAYNTMMHVLLENTKLLLRDIHGFAVLRKKAPMKIMVVGRSGSGKDTLANLLKETYGYTQLYSTTTRPRRTPNEDTHVFVSEEEANQMTDRVAETVIDGYQYFATKGQLEESDIYLIDPRGLDCVCKNAPDTPLYVVYVEASQDTRLRRAKARAADPDEAEKIFYSRQASEDAQFTEFETLIKDREAFQKAYPTARRLRILANDNDDITNIQAFAQMLDWEVNK